MTDCKYFNISKIFSQDRLSEQDIHLIKLEDKCCSFYLLLSAAKLGKLELCKQLRNIIDIDPTKDKTISSTFSLACQQGYLGMAKWLVFTFIEDVENLPEKKPLLDPHFNGEEPFRWGAAFGHIEICMWLIERFPETDHTARQDYAFRWACRNNHFELSKWIYKVLKRIDISAKNDEAFKWACRCKNKDIVVWLAGMSERYSYEI